MCLQLNYVSAPTIWLAQDFLLNKDEAASSEKFEERGNKSRGDTPIAPAPHVFVFIYFCWRIISILMSKNLSFMEGHMKKRAYLPANTWREAYPMQGVHHHNIVGIVTIHLLSAFFMAWWTRNMVQQGCMRWPQWGHREGQGGPGHQKGGAAEMNEVITGGSQRGSARPRTPEGARQYM
jgi:hypothetical protein